MIYRSAPVRRGPEKDYECKHTARVANKLKVKFILFHCFKKDDVYDIYF